MPRKNEERLAKLLKGIKVPLSGSLWYRKEDVETDDYLVQLKTTSKGTASFKLSVLDILVKHSLVSHKKPLLVLEFTKEGCFEPMWVAMPLGDYLELK